MCTVDIQATLPRGDADAVAQEARMLVRHWSTPDGGLVAFDYGDPEALGVKPGLAEVMFRAFAEEARQHLAAAE
jgi:hypothetical protein